MEIGEKIKQLRIELELSQDELAKRVGYKSRSSIQKIEAARKLPLDKVELMANALGTTPGYLMGWEDEDGTRTPQGKLLDIYIKNLEDQRILDLYHNATPEARAAVDLLLKASQPKPELPHLH